MNVDVCRTYAPPTASIVRLLGDGIAYFLWAKVDISIIEIMLFTSEGYIQIFMR